ncbi:signal recognition particle-docking protein FtsY [Halanaerobacter jeridensis]|uniref:Signal recognition particle receptor FtsY n=1 Tax=Halanaerobacter jeridensis TaxID=706427 RepID=A0A938XNE3_9FIRM|nr:signal recognition particle-docking protein FtsY [Halanaerobacter jeridensis]MBM7555312.1 fused signal recognition particle receptor [Halanaerobacter jeridensis]
MLKKIFGLGSDEEEEEKEQEEVEEEIEETQEEDDDDGKSLFGRLKEGLSKTRDGFVSQLESLFRSYDKINEELYEDLEEILIQADVGVQTTMKLVDDIKEKAREEKIKDPNKLINILQDDILEMLNQTEEDDEQPTILMVVGVNGAGKTTTIGKIAQRAKQDDKDVLLAAGDTFRAAAIEQLEAWANKVGTEVISHQEGADSAAVAYDAVQSAKSKETDLLIVDTAGRLHTQSNLMDELEKVKRVIEKESGPMKVEVLLVLDATTGQNAVSQAKLFDEAVDVDGIALTKLDGTAKGGVVIAIREELGIPIRLIGVGEDLEDLQDFEPESFVDALFDF